MDSQIDTNDWRNMLLPPLSKMFISVYESIHLYKLEEQYHYLYCPENCKSHKTYFVGIILTSFIKSYFMDDRISLFNIAVAGILIFTFSSVHSVYKHCNLYFSCFFWSVMRVISYLTVLIKCFKLPKHFDSCYHSYVHIMPLGLC